MTRIYTKTGDAGDTGLVGGGRVSKDDARVHAYGEIDETNAAIGAARATAPTDRSDELLAAVQRDLFTVGGRLATPEPELAALEAAIDAADAELPPLRAFVLPGGTPHAAALHLARAVCRRAERAVVRLSHAEAVPPEILVYLNRLSDLLFTLARLANHRAGYPDVTW